MKMPQDSSEDPSRFLAHVEAWDQHETLFEKFYQKTDADKDSIGGLRRRRKRASNASDAPIKTVSLIEKDGILLWCDDVPAEAEPSTLDVGPRRRRLRRRAGQSVPQVPLPAEMKDGPLVLTRAFPVLHPNQIVAAVGAIDQKLNPALNELLHSRLRPLRKTPDGTFRLDDSDVTGTLGGRTLLFVHGTFSNSENMLGEFNATDRGRRFLDQALRGARKYDNVVFFDHATLAVSPLINALELGRAFAASSGQIDVIAHSRGGLVVRWWLEAFGKSLGVLPAMPVRAVLVGSPLNGTTLAAPDRLRGVLSLISNIGAFAEATLKLGAANPFIWVAGALVHVVVSATGALAKTPVVDGLVALIPGLCGQSAVNNNHELDRLRLGPCAVDPKYYAVQSNFELDPGSKWKFWAYLAKAAASNITDAIFDGPNDMVVNTPSMIDLGVPHLGLAADPHNFGTNSEVWHCNYFRQEETIEYIETHFS
jgi:pimeloyl-ACP methyl ester carboxylesterase